jgi:branched-chain amino acid transport system ATP-binding protein
MSALLTCSGLDAGYAGKPVVWGLELTVDQGEVVTILGPNGAGKTTTLLTLAGLIPAVSGSVRVDGDVLPNGKAVAATKKGVVLVPDDRALFTTLTTLENLELARRKGGMTVDDVVAYFPDLEKRLDVRAGLLSGGEQQMLAIGRGLAQQPRVLLIDELSMGLAPIIVERLLPVIKNIASDTGTAVVLVEQHVQLALRAADRALVMVHGNVAVTDTAQNLLADSTVIERAYLGDVVAGA